MLPALRMTNRSPGSCWVNSSGTTRLSEQDTNKVPGFCVVARCLNKSLRGVKASRWNLRKPSMRCCMVVLLASLMGQGWKFSAIASKTGLLCFL
ncbi:hypothetical protein PFLmoz3_03055 [Pseudomonas fluorescens]|uniref:Uncharacterized protein n=1 Tax=Pseudomonas fluorescens TaxID=294 RepID=A0A120G7G3_PSEFL|nr:hypothetical protein PFLmoz3_03055 [Pseudomonas fluorescens]